MEEISLEESGKHIIYQNTKRWEITALIVCQLVQTISYLLMFIILSIFIYGCAMLYSHIILTLDDLRVLIEYATKLIHSNPGTF